MRWHTYIHECAVVSQVVCAVCGIDGLSPWQLRTNTDTFTSLKKPQLLFSILVALDRWISGA